MTNLDILTTHMPTLMQILSKPVWDAGDFYKVFSELGKMALQRKVKVTISESDMSREVDFEHRWDAKMFGRPRDIKPRPRSNKGSFTHHVEELL